MPEDHPQDDERLAELLAQFDEQLEDGQPINPLSGVSSVLDEQEVQRLERAKRCVELLNQFRPPVEPAKSQDSTIVKSLDESRPTNVPHDAEIVPEAFGRYRIVKQLGQGGMGAVYLAHDTVLDRQVALKVPHFSSSDPEVLDRFYREARAAATIDHPNICPVYDVGEIDGTHYLTMAYIEGRSLAEMIKGYGPMPQRAAAQLIRKLASALKDAHNRGVIHRDLKPSNIMINHRNEPVIMDFGLARRDDAGDIQLTQTGAILGTPAYMSPEQVAGMVEAMGPGCDIYSLGVMLYELLAGQLPFQGSVALVLAQIARDEPAAISSIQKHVAPELESICQRAMAKLVDQRYSSVDELAGALAAYLKTAPREADDEELAETMPVGDTAEQADSLRRLFSALDSDGDMQSAPAVTPKRSRKRPTVAVLMASVFAIVFATVVWVITDNGKLKIEFNGHDIRVNVLEKGKVVQVIDPSRAEISLHTGSYEVHVAGDKKTSFSLTEKTITMTRNKDVVVRVERLIAKKSDKKHKPRKDNAKNEKNQTQNSSTTSNENEDSTKVVFEYDAELRELLEKVQANQGLLPNDELVVELRRKLEKRIADQPASIESMAVAGLLAGTPSPTDRLERSNIKEFELASLGNGNPDEAPAELVAVMGDSRLQHWSMVTSVDAAQEQNVIVSSSLDKTVCVWDLSTGELIHRERYPDVIRSLALSRSGEQVLLGHADRRVTLCKTKTLEVVDKFTVNAEPVVTFSPDGKRFACSSDRDINIYDVQTLAKIAFIRNAHMGRNISSIAFNPDGTMLASMGKGGQLPSVSRPAASLWDLSGEEPELIKSFLVPNERGSVAFGEQGKNLLIGVQRQITIYDIEAQSDSTTNLRNEIVQHLRVSPNGKNVDALFSTTDGAMQLARLDSTNGRTLKQVAVRMQFARKLVYTDDESQFVVGGQNIQIVDTKSNKPKHVHSGHQGQINAVAFSRDGQLIASVATDDTLRIWNVATGEEIRTLAQDRKLFDVAFHPKEHSVVAAFQPGGIGFMPPNGNGSAKTFWTEQDEEMRNDSPRRFTISPDGKLLAAVGTRGMRIWDTSSDGPAIANEQRGHAIACSPDSKTIAISSGSQVHLYDSAGKQTGTLQGHRGNEQVLSIAFHPDNATLAIGAADGSISFVHRTTGATGPLIEGHADGVRDLDFSRDGRLLASASVDGSVSVWDVMGEGAPTTFRIGENPGCARVMFSPDGRHLATANGNGTIFVFRLGPPAVRRPFQMKWPEANEPESVDDAESAERQRRIADLAKQVQSLDADDLGSNEHLEFRTQVSLAISESRGTAELPATLQLANKVLWPADTLSRDDIAANFLTEAQHDLKGDLPPEVVAVWGNNRFTHWGMVRDVAMLNEGRELATLGSDHCVKIWNLETGETIRRIELETVATKLLALPESERLVVFHSSNTVSVIDPKSGELLKSYRTLPVFDSTADGSRLLTYDISRGRIVMIDAATGTQQRTIDPLERRLNTFAVSPTGEYFATAGFERKTRVQGKDGSSLFEVQLNDRVRAMFRFSDDSKFFACATQVNPIKIKLFELPSGKEKGEVEVDFLPTVLRFVGDQLAMFDSRQIRFYGIESQELSRTIASENSMASFHVFPDLNLVVILTTYGDLEFYDLETGQPKTSPTNVGRQLKQAACSRDGQHIAAATYDRDLQMRNLLNARTTTLSGHRSPVSAIAFSSCARFLASGDRDGEVIIWNAKSGRRLRNLPSQSGMIENLAFSPADHSLVTLRGSYGASISNPETAESTGEFNTDRDYTTHLVFGPRGRNVIVAGTRGVAKMDVDGKQTLRPILGGISRAIAYSPAGETMAAASNSNVSIFDAKTAQQQHEVKLDLLERVNDMCYSPNGKNIAVATGGGTVVIIAATSGEIAREFQIGPSRGNVHSVDYDPTGRHLIVGNSNGTVYILRI